MLIFDIGGTFIKYAIVENSTIIFKQKVSTPDGLDIIDMLIDIANQISITYKFDQIGISTAGQVDVSRGRIIFASSTIPNYTGCELKKSLSKYFNQEVFVLNDVEACLHNFDEHEELLYIALGTGIGGAYKVDGRIIRGMNGVAFEIGHTYLKDDKTFEEICSTKALLERYYLLTGKLITGEHLDVLFGQKDVIVIELINQYIDDLILGIINLKYVIDFKHIIIGGGITEAAFFTSELIYQALDKVQAKTDLTTINLEISPLGNDAALLGVYNYIVTQKQRTFNNQ